MERSVALRRLRRILGDRLGYRIDPKAPTPEERAAAKAELEASLDQFEELKKLRDARHQAILAADEGYQSLKAACEAARERRDQLSSIRARYKITVGVSGDLFFVVRAQGDSWEEVIAKLTV